MRLEKKTTRMAQPIHTYRTTREIKHTPVKKSEPVVSQSKGGGKAHSTHNEKRGLGKASPRCFSRSFSGTFHRRIGRRCLHSSPRRGDNQIEKSETPYEGCVTSSCCVSYRVLAITPEQELFICSVLSQIVNGH